MDDRQILRHISELIESEKDLRARLGAGAISESEEHEKLTAIETELDQAWDLLRQRRALREFGGNADTAHTRSADQVENYLD